MPTPIDRTPLTDLDPGQHADPTVTAVLRLFDTATIPCHGGVVACAGLPAAGKTTLAQKIIAARPEIVVIDKDTVAHNIATGATGTTLEQVCMGRLTGNPDDRDSQVYRTRVLPYTMRLVAAYTAMVSSAGLPVLLDLPFIAQANTALADGSTLAEAITAEVVDVDAALWLTVPAEDQMYRMLSRGARRDDGKLADFRAYRATLGAAGTQNPRADLCIQSTGSDRH